MLHDLQPEIETLSDEQRHIEHIMLALRTSKGVAKNQVCMDKAYPYIQQGMLTEHNNQLIATTKGFHILNRIIEDLI